MNIDVLCIGATAFDVNMKVRNHPNPNDKSLADFMNNCGGGPAANASVAIARLGLNSAFIGYLGNDVFGEIHFKELKENKVNTEFIIRGEDKTPFSTILIKPNGDRSIINYNERKKYLNPNEINKLKFTPKVILCDGHEPEIANYFIDQFMGKGTISILDAGSVHYGTKLLMNKVDYLVTSEKFAKDFTKEQNENLALKKLKKENQNVVITLGENGVVYDTTNGKGKLKAFNIDALDTTGAGDSFHGAFAYCLAEEIDIENSIIFSSAAAALTCCKIGARIGLPSKDEVVNFINMQKNING